MTNRLHIVHIAGSREAICSELRQEDLAHTITTGEGWSPEWGAELSHVLYFYTDDREQIRSAVTRALWAAEQDCALWYDSNRGSAILLDQDGSERPL